MKRVAPLILFACAAALPSQRAAESPQPTTAAPGQIIDGNLTLRNLDGQQVRLKELLGKVTVLNFFSIESSSQDGANARFAALQAEFARVRFLHVDSCIHEIGLRPAKAAPDGKPAIRPYDRIRKHLAKHELPFEVFVDHQHAFADALDAKTTPHLFVLDAAGRLIYRGADDFKKNGKVPRLLRKLLAGDSVKPHEATPQGTPIPRVRKGSAGQTLVIDNVELAIETARREGKLLLYNFSGHNCANCRVVEEHTFKQEPVRELLRDHFVEARLHTDTQGMLTITQLNANRNLQSKLTGHKATPAYVVADPIKDTVYGQLVLQGSWEDWPKLFRDALHESATGAGRKVK